jgi:hypothetical protein
LDKVTITFIVICSQEESTLSPTAIMPDQFSTFGELLKYLRRQARITQRELAIAVGYSDT